MIRKSTLLLFFAFLLSIYNISHAQKVNFSNNQIKFEVDINKQNDSLFIVNRTIINKTNDVIYVPLFGGTFYHDRILMGIRLSTMTIKAGCFATGYYSEVGYRLISVNPKDTLNSTQTICFDSQRHFDEIEINFDYIIPSLLSKEASKEFLSSLGKIYESTDDSYYARNDIYLKYGERISFLINCNEP